jgi:extracellular elastinolytic metalloproteinase
MRKSLLILLAVLSFSITKAQVSEADATLARQLVVKNGTAIGLTEQDQQNLLVSSAYKTKDGLQMVYLQQSFRGIPVYNQMRVLAFKNDRLVSNAGSFLPEMQKITRSDGRPSVSVVTALQTALTDAKVTALEAAVPIYTSTDGHEFEFGRLGVTNENIRASLLWYPIEE